MGRVDSPVDALGNPVGDEFIVNNSTSGNQTNPSVGVDKLGRFAVTWTTRNPVYGKDIYGRSFAANGTPLGVEYKIGLLDLGDQEWSRMAMDDNGNFVVTWSSVSTLSGWDVYYRVFNLAGTPLTVESLVNQTTAGDQNFSAVAMDRLGFFVIVWQSQTQSGGDWDIRGYFSGQIVMREFLDRYPFPATVSIVEGETSTAGVYPQLSKDLEPIAKQMFKLPNVEVASHSFSHPFDWVAAAKGQTKLTDSKDPVHMPVPGYKYSAAREVGDRSSTSTTLAPPDKPAKVFLWSGAALPAVDALRESYASNLVNMNGGACELPARQPHAVADPVAGPLGGRVPAGLRPGPERERLHQRVARAVLRLPATSSASFRFTESPRRLKPINIYYHFYSGTKLGLDHRPARGLPVRDGARDPAHLRQRDGGQGRRTSTG